MPIQLHIQKMEREADVIKKNEKSANDYLTQTLRFSRLIFNVVYIIIVSVYGHDNRFMGNTYIRMLLVILAAK